ncbi:hypothetical protein BDR07DRAFT_1484039 [Suillus spraguei]|nr:hypothetical protein BDR07DRAFT_1484039 [Suillus spraguei]
MEDEGTMGSSVDFQTIVDEGVSLRQDLLLGGTPGFVSDELGVPEFLTQNDTYSDEKMLPEFSARRDRQPRVRAGWPR